jgi:hypothetical protein
LFRSTEGIESTGIRAILFTLTQTCSKGGVVTEGADVPVGDAVATAKVVHAG